MKPFILLPAFALVLSSAPLVAQDSSVSLSSVTTKTKQHVMALAIQYEERINKIISRTDYAELGPDLPVFFTPKFDVITGEKDAFKAYNLTLTALAVKFADSTSVPGTSVKTPNTKKTIHTFPVSAGLEADGNLKTKNYLIEIGYAPWFMKESEVPDFLKFQHFKCGAFVQLGKKSQEKSAQAGASGGDVDQSAERDGEKLLRLKTAFRLDYPLLQSNGKTLLEISFIGSGWFDVQNSRTYHKIDGKASYYLNETKKLELSYEHGSGAPMFNKGDQFGGSLVLVF